MALMTGCFTLDLLKHIPIELLPILVFYDFAAAFPSISQEFLMLVLEKRGCPRGLINFFESVYFMNSTYMNNEVGLKFVYWVLCGILQGCPASCLPLLSTPFSK